MCASTQLPFIDTHTHIYAEEFASDREEVVRRACEAGAQALLLPNIDEASVSPMLDLCRAYPGFCYPMMGLHPTELPADPFPLLDRMEQRLQAAGMPYIGIGEVGIDLYWDASRREEQVEVFRRQIEWSIKYGLPLIIHSRAAHEDIVETLRPFAERVPGGIFHCFGGNEAEARELAGLFPQFMFGIGGVLTFKKSTLPEVLRCAIPLTRIVVETDAPYLAPVPYRGKRNEPSYIPWVLRKLAECYGLTPGETAQQCLCNTRRLFRL